MTEKPRHAGEGWVPPRPDMTWEEYVAQYSEQAIVHGPWEVWQEESPPPPAFDWFFVLGWGRTGTSVLAQVLSEHSRVYCGVEECAVRSLLGLFTARRIYTLQSGAIRYASDFFSPWTTAQLRALCEAWRSVRHPDAAVVGDKDMCYWRIRELVRRVFPHCCLFWTVRNPLDWLSSLINLPTGHSTVHWDGTVQGAYFLWTKAEDYLRAMRQASAEGLYIVDFCAFFDGDVLRVVAEDCFARLGVEASSELLNRIADRYARSPESAVGRWRNDVLLQEALTQAQARMSDAQRQVLGCLQTEEWYDLLVLGTEEEGIGWACVN